MEQKKEKNNNIFIIVLFVIIFILVLFLPKIYEFIESEKLPEVQKIEVNKKEEIKEVSEEIIETIHYPIMRNSIYDSNTYYNLDTFTISNMTNNDILYNAFMNMIIYEGNIVSSNIKGNCTSVSKQFDANYLDLRIKNILGKNTKYNLESFYVSEDSNDNYKGIWTYNDSIFIYNGLCETKASNTKYYNLEELIKYKYENNDIVSYYYVGFAKVVDNNYVIYSDPNMTNEISRGIFTNVEDLNNVFKTINKENKKIYKYTFKNTLCTYNEYCLYEGKWVNEIK